MEVKWRMGALTVNRIIYIAAFGAFIVIIGVYLGWTGFDQIIQKSLHETLSLHNGSKGYAVWKTVPVKIKFSAYLFNVTNPEEIQLGAKPILQEAGPYIYEIQTSRKNVTMLPDGTISYYDENMYSYASHFQNNKPLDEEITLLNVGLLGAATLVERIFPFGLSLINEAIPFLFPNSSDMFIRASAKDILFDGVMIQCNYTSGSAMPICNGLKARAPPTIIRDEATKHYSFAMFRHRNSSLSGPYRIKDGVNNFSDKGQVVEVKNKNYLPYWEKNSTCSQIKGTDSTIFSPITDPKEKIYIYVPDVCLSLSAICTNKTTMHSIPVYKYESSKNNFASKDEFPENSCKCTMPDDKKKQPFCFKKGAFEAFECQASPIVFSEPHFLNADPSYSNYVDGLKPDPEKHLTYVNLEPLTGMPISGRKRIQMNMLLKKIKGITLLTNVSEGLFPIGWVEEGADLGSDEINELAHLYYVLDTFKYVRWIIISVGLALMAVALLMYIKLKHLLCFNNNQVSSEVEYTVNHTRGMQEEPQKLSTLGTSKLSENNEIHTITNNMYPTFGNKEDIPIPITGTALPR